MMYCIYNAIKTPDGTVLWCKHRHDFKTYLDSVSTEEYMNDGGESYVGRSVNSVPYEDLSIWVDTDNPKLTTAVRSAPFWRSYGKNGEFYPDGVYLSLDKMETEHIEAILETQGHIQGSVIEELFKLELNQRKLNV